MRGEHERAEELMAHLQATGDKMGLAQQGDAVAGAFFATRMWRGEHEQILAVIQGLLEDNVLPMDAAMLSWFSLLPWALGAEAALALGDRDLAATTYQLLAPHAGRMACAGSGSALGPVDAFLAMAAATTGEAEIAARHAADALALCRTWRIPLVAEWISDQRDRFSF
jgi:hypothetical protein